MVRADCCACSLIARSPIPSAAEALEARERYKVQVLKDALKTFKEGAAKREAPRLLRAALRSR